MTFSAVTLPRIRDVRRSLSTVLAATLRGLPIPLRDRLRPVDTAEGGRERVVDVLGRTAIDDDADGLAVDFGAPAPRRRVFVIPGGRAFGAAPWLAAPP